MATLDSSVGTSTANSYVSVADADEYFSSHINSSLWDSQTNKSDLLIYATQLLDQYMDWDGIRVNDESQQALEWPRIVEDYPNNVIPKRVVQATCELALYVAQNGKAFNLADVSRVKVGPITIDIDSDSSGFILPPQITRILLPVGSSKNLPKNGVNTVAIYR